MKAKNRKCFLWLVALLTFALPGVAVAADVDVFAEGAYTASQLVVNVYANINVDNLCSYGVSLNYDTGKLTAGTATKNDGVWYFGTTAAKQPYMNPDTSIPGKIVFIGGKLDTGTPTAGVTGSRVLLGQATFTRSESSLGLGTTAQDYFGINLELGKVAPYDNFVTTAGVVKDQGGVAYNTANKVRERGDANADGKFDIADLVLVRSSVNSDNFAPYVNCNGDAKIDIADLVCVRSKIP